MRTFDFVAGPRFHGVMLAMQAGTPGGVIAHDSRTREMCETMLIPVRMYDDMPASFAASDLPSLFEFEAAAYDCRRSELANRYVDMLTAAGIHAERCASVLSGASRPRPWRRSELQNWPLRLEELLPAYALVFCLVWFELSLR